VVLFDHTLRSGDGTEREARLIREPVLSAHNDYTEWSGPQRVRDLLPDEAESLLKGLISAGAAKTTEARSPCMPTGTIAGLPGGRLSTLESVTDI
jgi:hypothetical protein